ncbi:SET domain-containing protein-lysine N-methyltransferase [Candidatus Woesearchaeota archaeon]|nr:SET domain-containing protein-lysine N-methyltransferase [Candidatus Woesearchaeota archaeon]
MVLSHSPQEMSALEDSAKGIIAIRKSTIGGKGYFAKRNITLGTLILETHGKIISHQTEFHSLQLDIGVHLEPFPYGGRYFNHHCEGNIEITTTERGLYQFFAKRDIQRGEELTYPYFLTELAWSAIAKPHLTTCRCGSPICKGYVASFSMLSPAEQKDLLRRKKVAQYISESYQHS